MIQVTFTFDSIEKAVATLGSLMQKGAPVPTLANPAAPAAVEKKSTRKPRADAGKERGPYKNVADAGSTPGAGLQPVVGGQSTSPGEAIAPAPAAPQTAAPTEQNPQPEPPVVAATGAAGQPTAAAAPSEAEAQTALTALFNTKGLAAAQATLGKFGVQALRHLPADKRGEFIAAANGAAK